VEIYTDDPASVNGRADEIELPAFLPRRPAQAAIARKRRRIRPESWASLNAAIVKEHRTLALLKPDSPRVRPTLPVLRLREPA
jgi:hypothetical protein